MKSIRRRNFTMSVLVVSVATALVAAERVQAAPIPVPDGGSSVSTTLAINQEIPVLGETTSTGTQYGSVQPGQTYTVKCYRDGDTVTNTQTKSSSQHWALITDTANPATSLGYVPAIALKLNDITNQVPACVDISVEAPPKPGPKPSKGKSRLTDLLAFPLFFAFTKNVIDQRSRADCLNHPPLPGFNGKVENNGNGWNEYTTGPGGRAAMATACLDSTHMLGTVPSDGLAVVGLAAAQAKATSQNTAADPPAAWATPRARDVARCHLIAAVLGGNGDEPSNFVPCWGQPTNNPGMTAVEATVRYYVGGGSVKATLSPGEAILYVVTPHYKTFTSTVPTSITMIAYLQSPGMPPPGKEVVSEIVPNEKAFTTVRDHQIVINLGD